MTDRERLLKLATATTKELAQIDGILSGELPGTHPSNVDIKTITLTEAAMRLGVSRPTIYRMTRNGELAVVKLNGVNRVRLQSLIDRANGVNLPKC